MASPILSILRGAGQGALQNREDARRRQLEDEERQLREEDRRIRNEDRDFNRQLSILGLLRQPGMTVLGDEEEPGMPVAPPAGIPGATDRPDLVPRGPSAMDAADPVTVPPPSGIPGARPAAPPRPTSIREILRTELGGEPLRIGFDPEQTTEAIRQREAREERERADREKTETSARQRAAWEHLNKQSPRAYPAFVDGFNYIEELADIAAEGRIRGRQAADDARRSEESRKERELEQRTNRARTRVVNVLAAGGSRQDAMTALRSDGMDDVLSVDDVIALERETRGATPKTDPRTKERRDGIEKTLGTPVTQLQQDILDALSEGDTKDSVLAQLKAAGAPEATLTAARNYMRPLR